MKRHIALATLAALAFATPAAAKPAPLLDCPLRDMPFSSASPLIDIMLSPAAKAVLDKATGGKTSKIPERFAGTTPPSFAAILTLGNGAMMTGLSADAMPELNRQLAAIPVTHADKLARCARYDSVAPKLDIPSGKGPKILLFEKINGFKDAPSVNAAHAAFVAMAARKGWSIVTTENGAAFSPAILQKFDAVIWNNISGDVLTLSQRAAFQSFLKRGGAFIGVHGSAGDPAYFWDWYADTLLGVRFIGHPMMPQFQNATVRLNDDSHPVAAGLPKSWEMKDEWYSFKTSARASGSHIIASLDESTYTQIGMAGQKLAMGADHPIAWSRCIGKGRVFYSAIGHLPAQYSHPLYVQMLEQAITWATAKGASEGGGECRK
ncbi:MAG: hypothetical protein RLY97_2118 [Pseudomonadota bacterium]|jgi:type 1 glutamine amidotransferase